MKLAVAFLLTSCAALPALALETPPPSAKDPHVRTAVYDPSNRVQITLQKGRVSNISFDPAEQIKRITGVNLDNKDGIIETVSGSDGNQQPLVNNLPLIGMNVGETDLVVITVVDGKERPYIFDIKVVDAPSPDVSYALSFTYPIQEQQAKVQVARLTWKQKQEEKQREIATARLNTDPFYGPQNWQYLAQGIARPLAPIEVHDNGQITAFRYPGNMAQPAIFRVLDNEPGQPAACRGARPTTADLQATEQATDTQVMDDMIIVHMTGSHWRLRSDTAVLDIWNCAYDPIGQNPGTGTTSPDVVRALIPPKDMP